MNNDPELIRMLNAIVEQADAGKRHADVIGGDIHGELAKLYDLTSSLAQIALGLIEQTAMQAKIDEVERGGPPRPIPITIDGITHTREYRLRSGFFGAVVEERLVAEHRGTAYWRRLRLLETVHIFPLDEIHRRVVKAIADSQRRRGTSD